MADNFKELENGSGAAIDATYNYWGPAVTEQMQNGSQPQNIASIIDGMDDSELGSVDYGSWLEQSILSLDSDGDGLTDRRELELG